jgi:hypothetical protein
MINKTLLILFFFSSFIIYPQRIKSIIEYKKQGDSLIKNRISEFDLNKNKTREIIFNNRSNRITTTEFINNKKTLETQCDYFTKQDTCVLRSFSTFNTNKIDGTERQTCYEEDSLVRFIRDKKRKNKLEILKTYSWEFFPLKNPDFKNALVQTDTIVYDRKNRITKRIHYSQNQKEPILETYNYSKKGYGYKLSGTKNDTIIIYTYNKHQKFANRKKLDYTFNNSNNFEYVFEYY